jgi:hypothetical protein
MRKEIIVAAIAALATLFVVVPQPKAHADYFQYPCPYPFVGSGADVDVIAHGGGQYCDGPTEVNWSHYHCLSMGGGIGGGAIGIAPPIGGLSLGAFGGSGIGGNLGDCHYLCPDGTQAPFPNPPAAWVKHLVLDPKNNDCDQHMGIKGPSSTPLPNALPGNMAPGEGAPPGVAVPAFPGGLPLGVTNPPALPGPPPPPAPEPPAAAAPPAADSGSPLSPGSPLGLL